MFVYELHIFLPQATYVWAYAFSRACIHFVLVHANVHAFFVSCACACKEEIIIAMTKVSKQQHKNSTCHSKQNTAIFFEGKTATTKMNALLIYSFCKRRDSVY